MRIKPPNCKRSQGAVDARRRARRRTIVLQVPDKHDIRIAKGTDCLKFYNSEQSNNDRILPCKVSCSLCGTPIADEGRRMWLAFPSLFDFGFPPKVPKAFMPTCHIFYGSRVIDINDDLPKWSGHKNNSEKMFL